MSENGSLLVKAELALLLSRKGVKRRWGKSEKDITADEFFFNQQSSCGILQSSNELAAHNGQSRAGRANPNMETAETVHEETAYCIFMRQRGVLYTNEASLVHRECCSLLNTNHCNEVEGAGLTFTTYSRGAGQCFGCPCYRISCWCFRWPGSSAESRHRNLGSWTDVARGE